MCKNKEKRKTTLMVPALPHTSITLPKQTAAAAAAAESSVNTLSFNVKRLKNRVVFMF